MRSQLQNFIYGGKATLSKSDPQKFEGGEAEKDKSQPEFIMAKLPRYVQKSYKTKENGNKLLQWMPFNPTHHIINFNEFF